MRSALIAFVITLAAPTILAQSRPVPAPTTSPGTGHSTGTLAIAQDHQRGMSLTWTKDGTFRARNMPLSAVVAHAYGIRDNQLLGGPSWMRTMRVDVDAASTRALSRGDSQAMLRAFVADRLRLVVKSEPAPIPIYWLTKIRPDAPLGPGLRVSTRTCPTSPTPTATTSNAIPACAVRAEPGRLTASGVSMAAVAAELSTLLSTPVVERTTLTERYDATMTWATPGRGPASRPISPAVVTAALESQLGLTLLREQSPKHSLVIQHAEAPGR